MIYKKKDISDIFRDISNSSLVTGNNTSIISSNAAGGWWGSELTVRFEDDPGLASEDGHLWEDFN